MKELTFLLNLKNNLSAPLGKAQKSVESFSTNTDAALGKLGGGAAGIWATARGLAGLIRPADDLKKSLNELSTRNVGAGALKSISREASQFSTDFGVSATEFVGSVTVLRSSLADLRDDEMAGVARAANTLGVALKSGGADAAGFIAGMAKQFSGEAAAQGYVAFAESVASKTAWLVKNTGQDMAQIQSLLEGAKGTGTGYGVGMDEQFAVLAGLSGTLGSEASGVYESFLKSAKDGAKKLGVSLTDAQGSLLSFPDILDTLQAKYGETADGNLRIQEKLNEAFGDGANALLRSWGSANKLRKQIKELQGTQGLAGANSMAEKMSDMWSRLEQSGVRIRTAFGSALLPVFEPVINKIIEVSAQLGKWLEMFPNITRWLGYIAIAIAIVTGVLSVFALFSGIKAVSGVIGLTRAFSLLNPWLLTTRLGLLWLGIQAKAFSAWMLVCRIGALAWSAALGVASVAMRVYGVATAFAGGAMQLLLSPVTLIILAIAALAAGIWYAVTHWDELKTAIMDSAPFKFISGVLESFGSIAASAVEKVKGVFNGLWAWLKSTTMSALNWMIEKLNALPGVNIDLVGNNDELTAPALSAPAGMRPPSVDGGVGQTISSSASRTDNSRTVGTVNIYPGNQETFDSLLESRELYAG
ncbi:phage tail tape measure protein [Enterobacter sp. WCHEn045836]|uniref:phage tail tape measure protein n=1 Tax=Enterobacter sp. WCHEn045836 TaxID=2497434 RepID=UPI000F831CA2|nr:phage tail tape measure protein [Enterobacter sp. WCHEn045836]RTP98390.1 phage tail tape measure protein [Enterobacter sp. WCHEn045836]